VKGSAGRVYAHVSRASRKDLREAVEAARRAQAGWAAATAYLRGQVLYRVAEMMQGKADELADAVGAVGPARDRRVKGSMSPAAEVSASIDRVVHFAGWADKFSQVLGCHNAVAGPYYNFTFAEPTGVVCVVCPDDHPLLALVSMLAPVVCAGNTAVALASPANPIPGAVLGEVFATSDVPAGVVNVLTGDRAELIPNIAGHHGVNAVVAAGLPAAQSAALRAGSAENVKRVTTLGEPGRVGWADTNAWESPWMIEPFVEMKTVWHPASS
jgi:acyl-CoA reductase-like NAD-dependent aldehyde dehydrogenase